MDLDWKHYCVLYARYRDKRQEENLVDLVDVKDKIILNIGGGSDRIPQLCLERGARGAFVVDPSREMTKELDRSIKCFHGKINLFLGFFGRYSVIYDVIFSRQSINYWFSTATIKWLRKIMSDNGVFVFNTFNKKPPSEPFIKRYKWGGREYVEVSYCVGDTVYHFQSCAGEPPDFNSFQWISREMFHFVLLPFFTVEEIIEGSTSIYICKCKPYDQDGS